MSKQLHDGRRASYGWLAVVILAVVALAALLPVAAQAQTEPPMGLFFNGSAAGSAGGDHTLVAIREDGAAAIAFFDLDGGNTTAYTGTWALDPYGTVTLSLEMGEDEPCAEEDGVTAITFMPSPDADVLTAIHYPSCLWGDGGLSLVAISDEQMAVINDVYADAGLLPGPVFQSDVIEADDGERQYTLNLGAGEGAAFITDSLDGEEPLTEIGQWSANIYTITVVLTGTVDTLYEEPEELAFGFVKDGTGRIVAFEYDRERYGDQGLTLAYAPQLAELLAEAEAAANQIAGIYNSDVQPAADTPGLVQTLALFETGEAQNTLNYLNGEAPIVELGTWTDNEDGTIELVIEGTLEKEYDEPVTTVYTVAEQQLQAEDVILNKLSVIEPGSGESD